MKKLSVLVVIVSSILFLASCTSSEKVNVKTGAESIESTEQTEVKITEESEVKSTEKNEELNQKKSKIITIGINQFAQHPSLDNCRIGFIEGLKEAGYIDNENIKIDYQNAQTDITLASSIASAFVSKKYDLICAIATPSAQASYNAALEKEIPIVFSAMSDPLGSKLVKSLEKPENNITGVSDALPIEAQLKMIRAFLPEAKKIGILFTTSESNSESQIAIYKKLAPDYGFEIVTKGVNTATEISLATDSILKEVDCLTNLTDNTVVTALSLIIEKANSKQIPVFGSEEEQLKVGCIASESLDYVEIGRETAKLAIRIINGEKASEMSVKVNDASKPVVNKKVAELLNIEIPKEYENAQNIE